MLLRGVWSLLISPGGVVLSESTAKLTSGCRRPGRCPSIRIFGSRRRCRRLPQAKPSRPYRFGCDPEILRVGADDLVRVAGPGLAALEPPDSRLVYVGAGRDMDLLALCGRS